MSKAPSHNRIVVTGAGAGIGAGVAISLCSSGSSVVATDIDSTALEALPEELGHMRASLHTFPCDATDPNCATEVMRFATERVGGLDGLVNIVGGFPSTSNAEDIDDSTWHRILDLNLGACFRFCRAAIPLLREAGRGRIVNVASEAGRMPMFPTSAAYAAAKAGVIGLTKHLALELAPAGVTVNAVAPGTTRTPRIAQLWDEETERRIVSTVPLGRLAEVRDQVGPIRFLLSEDADFVTGATLDVNGGKLMM